MASGLLGAADLAATTNTTVYTVSDSVCSFSVNFCNRNSVGTSVRLAIAASGTPTAAEYVMYDVFVDGNGMVERTGLVAQSAKNVVVYSGSSGVSVQVYGYGG